MADELIEELWDEDAVKELVRVRVPVPDLEGVGGVVRDWVADRVDEGTNVTEGVADWVAVLVPVEVPVPEKDAVDVTVASALSVAVSVLVTLGDAERLGVGEGDPVLDEVAVPEAVEVALDVAVAVQLLEPVEEPLFVGERVNEEDTVARGVMLDVPVLEPEVEAESENEGVVVIEALEEGVGKADRVLVRVCVEDGVSLAVAEKLDVVLGVLLGLGASVQAYGGRTASPGSGAPSTAQPSEPMSRS